MIALFDDPINASDMVFRGTWRLAKSLQTLLDEANAVSPNRDKRYDGTIGDAAHASRPSRHNPNNAGVVCALDLTHCEAFDTYDLFDFLRAYPHPDLAYIISNRRVASRAKDWTSRPYTGSHPHNTHIHVAVGVGPDSEPLPPYDNTDLWGLAAWRGEDMTPEQDTLLRLNRVSHVARSYSDELNLALHQGNAARYEELVAQRNTAIEQERIRLGLTKAQVAGV